MMHSKYELRDLEAFWQVAQHGGYTAASEAESRPKSSLSMAVRRLERWLGVRLVERTSRNISLTDRGQQLLDQIDPLFSGLHHITSETRSESGNISGVLRIAAPYEFGARYVADAVRKLIRQHPDLWVQVDVKYDSVESLFAKGYDVVFTMSDGFLPDMDAVSCKLFSLPRGVFAAPSLLAANPPLETLGDLWNFPIICSTEQAEWFFTGAENSVTIAPMNNCVMRSSNADIRRQAAIDGFGAMRVTATFCADAVANGQLVQVLTQYTCLPLRVYGLVKERRLMPAEVRALFDVLAENFSPYNQPELVASDICRQA